MSSSPVEMLLSLFSHRLGPADRLAPKFGIHYLWFHVPRNGPRINLQPSTTIYILPSCLLWVRYRCRYSLDQSFVWSISPNDKRHWSHYPLGTSRKHWYTGTALEPRGPWTVLTYMEDIRKHGLLTKYRYFVLWGPVQCSMFNAQCITFSIIPEHFRVTFIAMVSFFWLIILSTIASRTPLKQQGSD